MDDVIGTGDYSFAQSSVDVFASKCSANAGSDNVTIRTSTLLPSPPVPSLALRRGGKENEKRIVAKRERVAEGRGRTSVKEEMRWKGRRERKNRSVPPLFLIAC